MSGQDELSRREHAAAWRDSAGAARWRASAGELLKFLAAFLGTQAQGLGLEERLADLPPGAPLSQWQDSLACIGLVGTELPAQQARRASELPALLISAPAEAAGAGAGASAVDGASPSCVAVLSQRDGKFECRLAGIEGSTWLSAEDLSREFPSGRWLAVRPQLFFDQRSLLYTLPQAGRWLWDHFDRNRPIFRWALIGTLALNIFSALVPFYSMAVYDRVLPHNALGSLGVLTTAALVVITFELLMRILRSHLLEVAARRMDVALSAQVFAQCLRMRAASRPASGGVLANTVRDFESVREFFSTGTLTVLGEAPFMLFYLAVIALVSGWLVLVPLLFAPLLLAVAWAALGPLARKVNEGMQESSQRTAHLFETMNGLDTVKALGAEAWSRRKWEGLTQVIAGNSLETREITSKVQYANAALLAASNVAVVALGAWLASEQALTMGQIIAASMLTGRALAPVGQIAGLIVRWNQTQLSYQALSRVMSAETDESTASLQAPPLTGALEFRDVSFAYPGAPPALEKLNLRIRPGERVGVIGRLGSGKSTLLRLLLNQYAPSAGGVLVNDLLTTQLEPQSLRRQIGYVPQDVTLFHGSLRENIELGRQPGDAALLEAIRTACLDEVLQQLPGGVGTQVGERGERLSGGQRQAVAIARALLAKPKLLLLDEPSSMMDPATENRLIQNLRSLAGTTIVLVTHRMAMLALVDRLLVFDKGRLVADGPRDEVLRSLSQAPTQAASTTSASPSASVRSSASTSAPTSASSSASSSVGSSDTAASSASTQAGSFNTNSSPGDRR